MNRLLGLFCIAVFVGCSGSEGATSDAAVTADAGADASSDAGTDAAEPLDMTVATDASDDLGVVADGGLDSGLDASVTACGSERPDLADTSGVEGLVIARDGTIYFSQSGGVGRITALGATESSWVDLGSGTSTVWGLALDASNEHLYVGSPTAEKVFVVTIATGVSETFYVDAGAPNGLTVGPDGALYYSDFSGGHVYRIATGDRTRTRVTSTTIAQANGVAFGPDGRLYVVSYATGVLHALTLVDGAETARDTVSTDLGNPDGLAFDADGRIYVGDNGGDRLLRLDADGTNMTVLRESLYAAANVEFGAGTLSCSDIYVASSSGVVRVEDGTAAGFVTPWH